METPEARLYYSVSRSKAIAVYRTPSIAANREQKPECPMWYGNTKSVLECIVRWLKTEPSKNDAEWQAHTDLVQVCLKEMAELAEPIINPPKEASSRYVHRPVADKLNRAMPYVRLMLTAMRDRDRSTALAHGEKTLRLI